jgi:class 3 adenylate cyclase
VIFAAEALALERHEEPNDASMPRTTHATVLFADMRGYTGLAEVLAPARVLPLLFEFFAILTRVTAAYGGEVFHMAGDGMMAGFGVDDPHRGGSREALGAANAMLHRFAVVASRWRRELRISTGIGVGIHLGEVALGYLGPPGKKSLTLVGDTTNVASLLCSHARAGEVLFSSTVAEALIADGGRLPATVGPVSILKIPRSILHGRRGVLDFWCIPALERLPLHTSTDRAVDPVERRYLGFNTGA